MRACSYASTLPAPSDLLLDVVRLTNVLTYLLTYLLPVT